MFDFTGYGENVLTFKAEENLNSEPVTIVADSTVGKATADAEFCGIAISTRSGAATVLMGGYAEMPFSGTAPKHGAESIVANGTGGVKCAEGGKKVTVIKVDEESSTVGFIF